MPKIYLRTDKTQYKYERHLDAGRTTPLWDVPPLKSFLFWKIIPNQFPHDRIARVNDMLIPKRRVRYWRKLRWYERLELRYIDKILERHYDSISRNYPSVISVPDIMHFHLYVLHDQTNKEVQT